MSIKSNFIINGYCLPEEILEQFPEYVILEKAFRHSNGGTIEVTINVGAHQDFSAVFFTRHHIHLVAASGDTLQELLRLCLKDHQDLVYKECQHIEKRKQTV